MRKLVNNINNLKKINFKDMYYKISSVEKVGFITAIILGIITHVFVFVNVLPNWDSMYNFVGDKLWMAMGRWYLNEAMSISSHFDLPFVNGIISIIYLAITAALIVNILELSKKLSAITVAALLVTFPVVTSTFSYMFLADGYMLGVLLATIAVFLTKKYKKGYLIAGVILGFSIGIYQVNISFAIILSMILIIFEVTNTDKHVIDNIKYAMKYVLMSIISLVVYFVILKVLTIVLGRGLGSYQGANEGFAISIESIKKMFIDFKNSFEIITGGSERLFIGIVLMAFICLAILIIYTIIYNNIHKNIWKMLLISIALIVTPMITGFAYFISTSTSYHMVMRMSWVLFFVLIVVLLERAMNNKKIETFIQQLYYGLPMIILWIIIFKFILLANTSYINMHQRYEKEYSLAIRIVDRLEMYEEYDSKTPVLFIGEPYTHSSENIYDKNIKYVTGTEGNRIFASDYHIKSFIKNYMGVTLDTPNQDKIDKIIHSNELNNIDKFPKLSCVEKIDDVIVFKLGE